MRPVSALRRGGGVYWAQDRADPAVVVGRQCDGRLAPGPSPIEAELMLWVPKDQGLRGAAVVGFRRTDGGRAADGYTRALGRTTVRS